jgi:Flp pilus assembly pilin Flp
MRGEKAAGEGEEGKLKVGFLKKRWRQCSGQGIAEYAWILVLIAVVAILLLRTIGATTNNMLADANANMPR